MVTYTLVINYYITVYINLLILLILKMPIIMHYYYSDDINIC